MNKQMQYQRTIRVYAPCAQEWIDEATVEVLDISEDIHGQDRLTFKCPLCQKSHTSLRVG